MKNIYFQEFFTSIKDVGLLKTIEHIWFTSLDYSFDLRYGTKTMSWESLEILDVESSNIHRGIDYHPTRARPFRKLMKKLNLPSSGVFVDFGSGKGKCLLLAIEWGFQKVVGLEFSNKLSEIAKENIGIYQKKTDRKSQIDLVVTDVMDYKIKDDENIFYFFNPFDDIVFGKVLNNIKKSLDTKHRKIWLIYYNPLCHDVFEKCDGFIKKSGEYKFDGHTIFVYENEN